MTNYTVHLRTNDHYACAHIHAESPEQALELTVDLAADDPAELGFPDYDEDLPLTQISIEDMGEELVSWTVDDLLDI